MKIETLPQEEHQAKLKVEVEPDILEKSKRKAARKIAERVKIAGFRPGKAPYNVIVKQIGEGAILEDAIDLLLEEVYPKIIEEADITPYGPGSLQNIVTLEPPTFEFAIPLAPEVDLGDYRSLRVEFIEKSVTEEDVNKVIENLRDRQATLEPVERAAIEGDMVYVFLNGERKGEEDESKKKLITDRRYPVIIEKADTDETNEWPYPGFSRELIGLNAGDEKTVDYNFPKDYEIDDLQNVTASYSLKIEEIKQRILPELSDEFAKSVGNYDNLEVLKEEIRKSLQEDFESNQKSEYESTIVDKLVEQAAFSYPPQMIDHEIDHVISDLEQNLTQQGLGIDLYLNSREMEMESLREEVRSTAEERVKRGLVLMEVANKENISVTAEDIEIETRQTVDMINQYYQPKDAKKLTSGDSLQSLVSNIMTNQITQRTLDRLSKIAKGETIEDEPSKEEGEVEIESTTETPEPVSVESEEDITNNSEESKQEANE